jgi:hypothetical protein
MDPLSATSHCFLLTSVLVINIVAICVYPMHKFVYLSMTISWHHKCGSSNRNFLCFVNLFVISVASVCVCIQCVYISWCKSHLISSLSPIHNDFSLATQMCIQKLQLLLFCLNCLWLVSQAV